jgi:AraC-like DNA-binding protein/quercetin dioxygenase-like cupin family protein
MLGHRQPVSKIRHTAEDEPHFVIRTVAATSRDGDVIPPHTHPWHQLIYSTTGVMTVHADQSTWIVPPTWAIWVPMQTTHSISFSGQTSLRTLYLRPGEWNAVRTYSCVIAVSTLLRELIVRACEIGILDGRLPIHSCIASLIVDSFLEQSVATLNLPMPADATLAKLAQRILDAPCDRRDVSLLAQRVGIGARTLERRFLAETGVSLGHWRRLARMIHALRQLAAGHAIKAVSRDVGYRSASAFVASFNNIFKKTPAQYFTND